MKVQIKELVENQVNILNAVKNLNERLEDLEGKANHGKKNDVKNILESQAMIDEIIVKNTDDIALMKKTKGENMSAIKLLESKIDYFDNEIAKIVKEKLQSKEQNTTKKTCKYFNRGFCNNFKNCEFYHSETICELFQKNRICLKQNCQDRHPKPCRYWIRGDCQRGEKCAYYHNIVRTYSDKYICSNKEQRK